MISSVGIYIYMCIVGEYNIHVYNIGMEVGECDLQRKPFARAGSSRRLAWAAPPVKIRRQRCYYFFFFGRKAHT